MASTPVKFLYFSWIRERVGLAEEEIALPSRVKTVSEMLVWMQGRNEQFAAALEFPDIIRVALDQEHVEHSDFVGTPSEIALFPPMTGG